MSMILQWNDDEYTAYWARQWQLPLVLDIQPQYDGSQSLVTESTWLKHINKPAFPVYCLDMTGKQILPSPTNIIQCFRDDCYLEALVLVIAWGSMTRTKGKIYTQSNDFIETTLRTCMLMTRQHDTVQHAWNMLVNRLQWSAVISSKVLHFLARSLDYEDTPPVPMDRKVVIEQVWPCFQSAIKAMQVAHDFPLPHPWSDSKVSWEAYNRYMTAIRYWSHAKTWTTTQFENTMFQEYFPTP